MSAERDVDNKAWTTALREAIAARDEGLYRRTLMQFLATREGVMFVEGLIKKPAALAVMRRSFGALAAPLGLSHPNDLVAWLQKDEATPQPVKSGARDVLSMAVPYLRFARSWARAVHKEDSYAVALAMMLFEPALGLCDRPAQPGKQSTDAAPPRDASPSATAVTAQPPSFERITQRA
jgi:hypothetical protein